MTGKILNPSINAGEVQDLKSIRMWIYQDLCVYERCSVAKYTNCIKGFGDDPKGISQSIWDGFMSLIENRNPNGPNNKYGYDYENPDHKVHMELTFQEYAFTTDQAVPGKVMTAQVWDLIPKKRTWSISNGHSQFWYYPYKFYYGVVYAEASTVVLQTPCPPGSWNTCYNKSQCTFDAIARPQDWEPLDDSNIVRPLATEPIYIPVGQCFPCVQSYNKNHYNYPNAPECTQGAVTNTGVCHIYPSYFLDYKRIYCAGGTAPPQYCPGGYESSSDYSKCVCKSGTYPDSNSECQPCPSGMYCVNGMAQHCEIDSYQSATGQSSCISCLNSVGTATWSCDREPNTAPARCELKYNVKSNTYLTMYINGTRCVPCSMCRNPTVDKYSPFNLDLIDCYI